VKISLEKLYPNPFRRMDKYPIDPHKIATLKASIQQTDFWDNLLARPCKDGFQLAYGHHRYFALRELGIKEIDIPVRDLSDATMIQIMANENATQELMTPAVIIETVLVVKDFLDGELAKCKTWEEFRSDESIRPNFKDIETEPAFRSVKAKGVGREIIQTFLGEPWKQHQIQNALSTIGDVKEELLDREAVELFDSSDNATQFRMLIKDKRVPVKEQLTIAREILKLRDSRPKHNKKITSNPGEGHTESYRRQFRDDMRTVAPQYFDEDRVIEEVQAAIRSWESCMAALGRASQNLADVLTKYKVEKMQGLEFAATAGAAYSMMEGMKEAMQLANETLKQQQPLLTGLGLTRLSFNNPKREGAQK